MHAMRFQPTVLTAVNAVLFLTGTQTPRPLGGPIGTEANRGHLQDALLSLGTAHTHFGHVQVGSSSNTAHCLQASVAPTSLSLTCPESRRELAWCALHVQWQ